MMETQYKEPVYNKPRTLEISGIKTVIVDPHNEVFDPWFNLSDETNESATLIHVDRHSDMADYEISLESFYEEGNSGIEDYTKELSICSFIAPAFHYNMVDRAYWIQPENKIEISSYGNPDYFKEPTIMENGLIRWNSKEYFYNGVNTKQKNMVNDVNETSNPLILDIDLDAFECVNDDVIYDGERRLLRTLDTLREMRKPNLITIARSQSPEQYTPKERVDYLENMTLKGLSNIY
jgi:hypothetical protein